MKYRRIAGFPRWVLAGLAGLALAFGLVPAQVADAQTTICQQAAMQTAAPLLAVANNFNPSGVAPMGYAPLAQPFGTNISEYALYGYGVPGYAAPRGRPPYAQMYPFGYPPAVVPGSPTPADPLTASALAEPDQRLTASAILDRAMTDGSFQAMPPDQQNNFLVQLGQLQQTEIAQRVSQANLQQQAQVNMVNIRRVPFELAAQFQERSRNWRDSYTLYSQTMLNLVQAACNPNSGLPAVVPPGAAGLAAARLTPGGLGTVGGTGLGSITNLAAFCLGSTALGICSSFR